jgi:ClpP class serine protease
MSGVPNPTNTTSPATARTLDSGEAGAEAIVTVFEQILAENERTHQPPAADEARARWIAQSTAQTLGKVTEPWTLTKIVQRLAADGELAGAEQSKVQDAIESIGDSATTVPAADVALAAYTRPIWLEEWGQERAQLSSDGFVILYEVVPLLAEADPAPPKPV